MELETAQTVLAIIVSVALVVWLAGLQILLTSSRAGKMPRDETGLADDVPDNWLAGNAEIQGDPRTLANKLAALLAKGDLGPVAIREKSDDRVSFERPNGGIAKRPAGHWFRQGEVRF